MLGFIQGAGDLKQCQGWDQSVEENEEGGGEGKEKEELVDVGQSDKPVA